MSDDKSTKHFPLPQDTQAFMCANCGAVSLFASNLCKPQGRGTRADWCGIKHQGSPEFCHNRVNNLRYQCKKCGQVAVSPELLCEPEKLSATD